MNDHVNRLIRDYVDGRLGDGDGRLVDSIDVGASKVIWLRNPPYDVTVLHPADGTPGPLGSSQEDPIDGVASVRLGSMSGLRDGGEEIVAVKILLAGVVAQAIEVDGTVVRREPMVPPGVLVAVELHDRPVTLRVLGDDGSLLQELVVAPDGSERVANERGSFTWGSG